MAIVLVLLLTIVLGCVDLGRSAQVLMAVANAAREGAYVGSTSPPRGASQAAWERLVRQAVIDDLASLASFDARQAVIDVTLAGADAAGRQHVRVQVTYPFRLAVPWPLLAREIELSRVAQMRVIR